jgi:hypothetical protein
MQSVRVGLTTQYRSSEVIHGLPASPPQRLAPQTVNNFAARRSASPDRMGLGVHFRYRFIPVARVGGPALLTISRHDDFELYRAARRSGLAR